MNTHNISFHGEIRKHNIFLDTPVIYASDQGWSSFPVECM